ncbi:MAG: transporter [Deltaproteobacteria bacterium]|nr:MAG: transporter [Deltaproteobacteria bacterium]
MIGGVEKALLALLLVVLMTGMGATLTFRQFGEVVRRPKGVLVGLASQFGWMPLVAFGLATALDLPAELALGLIIIGSTPGGTTSNLFTYYSGADLALSISMTVVSTLVAVVVMPLLLLVYAAPFTGDELELPLGNIVTTLALVLVPVGLGMAIRRRSERIAKMLERAGSYSGVAVLVLLIASSVVRNSSLFAQIPGAGYAAAFCLGVVGMGLGYGVARGVGLGLPQRRAVALETGIQNSPLAFGVILASFPDELTDRMLWLPMLYALFVLVSASVATLIFRRSAAGAAPR